MPLAHRCPRGSSVILCDSSTSNLSPLGPRGYDVEGRDSRCARWCSLAWKWLVSNNSIHAMLEAGSAGEGVSEEGRPTKGIPQYVHQLILGLSKLIKILGCPRGPPPPSHETTRSLVQRTGCLWMSSIAEYGRGCCTFELAITQYHRNMPLSLPESSNPQLQFGSFPHHIQCEMDEPGPQRWSAQTAVRTWPAPSVSGSSTRCPSYLVPVDPATARPSIEFPLLRSPAGPCPGRLPKTWASH